MSTIKPIPTPEVIQKTLEKFREKLSKADDPEKIEHTCKETVEALTPAREIRLLLWNDEGGLLKECSGEEHPLDPRKRSLIGKALQSQKALYTNDVRREAEYLPSLDNPFDYPVKSLLLAPLLHPESPRVVAIVWAAIPQGDLHQFVREDLEALKELLNLLPLKQLDILIKHTPKNSKEMTSKESKQDKTPSSEETDHSLPPKEPSTEAMQEKISETSKDQSQSPSPFSSGMEAPALIKAIRSLLKSRKN